MSEWEAVAVEGPEAVARGFVAGFLAGRGVDPRIAACTDEIQPEESTLAEWIRDLFGRGTHQVVLMPVPHGAALVAALAAGAHPDLSAGRRQPVGEGTFSFRAETPSPEGAARIRATLFGTMPPGITRTEVREEGEVDPTARGVELYAPAPEFMYRAEGTFRGTLPDIVLLRRQAAGLDFVTVSPLVLEAIG